MAYPSDDKCRPRIKMTSGEWYAFAPNNSPMAMAYLVKAINFVRDRNARLRAVQRKQAKRLAASTPQKGEKL